MTTPKLLLMLKARDLVQKGNKNVRVKRILAALDAEKESSGKSWGDILRGQRGLRNFDDWFLDNRIRLDWQKAPAIAIKGMETDSTVDEDGVAGRFGISGFARLIAALTMEEDIRTALVESGLARTREQQDCRIPRDAFWTTKVEPKFNSPEFKPVIDLRGVLDDVNAATAPTKRWTGPDLKKQYSEARAQFTIAFNNWSVSGQMSTTNFADFCQHGKRDGLTIMGKKQLVMFSMFRCGTAHECTDILDFTLRTVPPSVAIETVLNKGPVPEEANPREAAQSSRKRKTETVKSLEALNDSMGRIARAIERSEAGEALSAIAQEATAAEDKLRMFSAYMEVSRMEEEAKNEELKAIFAKEKHRLHQFLQNN